MGLVNIDTEDAVRVKEFEDGKTIQVRVTVSKNDRSDYDKGKTVTVLHNGRKIAGRIASDPILIDRKREDGNITLSLIVEKATE